MIRALRRWLLGVEPDGPPLLADPLYRWEVRRYWTLSRYGWTAALLFLWWGLLVGCLLFSGQAAISGLGEMVAWTLGVSLAARLPLSFLTASGAALCIAPERASGCLEQFVLTPMDPWRFCLARMAARLRGIFVFWLAMGVALAAGSLLAWMMNGEVGGPGGAVLLLMMVALGQIDCAGMLVADAALGMTFSAEDRNPIAAVVHAFAACFVLAPLIQGVIFLCVVGAALALASTRLTGDWALLLGLSGVVLIRLVIAALTTRYFPRDTRRMMEKYFADPESLA